jgi:hypothetical protein
MLWREQRGGVPHNRWLLAEGAAGGAGESGSKAVTAARG